MTGKSIEELESSVNILLPDMQDVKGTLQHMVDRVSKTEKKKSFGEQNFGAREEGGICAYVICLKKKKKRR